MFVENISETALDLWNMMGVFLPFFILIGVFQLSLTIFCTLKLLSSKQKIPTEEESFIESITFFNLRLSGVALTVGLIGTVYGLVSALSNLALGWQTADQEVLANVMHGASIALTSTLGALILARLWGDEINDGLIARIKKKYGIPDSDEVARKQLSVMSTMLTTLASIRKSLKKNHKAPGHKKRSENSIQNEIEHTFFSD